VKKKIRFKIEPDEAVVEASQDVTILETLLDAGFKVDHSCGGSATCGTCRIWVEAEGTPLEPPNQVEQDLRAEMPFDSNERLSCQNYPVEGMIIRLKSPKCYS